jgi:hypothetical protein
MLQVMKSGARVLLKNGLPLPLEHNNGKPPSPTISHKEENR